ncbi:MAG: 50S ribosomal protein L9 [Nitrospirae bacterium]|jgi:ribosomal protein L9|nr:50S ribosomal protein L9 [Nitrospirota bacterium]MCL5285271.1 50S ribosomal protein L9 [Nitrospirota bacterium]
MGKTDVILKQKIDNLGNPGDLVSVSAGYARNYLLPKNLCVLAGKEELAALEVRKEQIRKKALKEQEHLATLARTLSDLLLRVPVKTGENGKLFGSVTTMHLADLLAQKEIRVDKKQLHIESPIRELGEYVVSVNLGHSLHASLKIEVVSE